MKEFSNKRMESVLLIEKEDVNDKIIYKIRGKHVDYIIAPIELKDNKLFLDQADCSITVLGIRRGKILYYE